MRRIINWSEWSIATKILAIFLGLSIVSMGVLGILAFINIKEMGNYALNTSTLLGETAIKDSTEALNTLGEYTITQKARDVAKQTEMYLKDFPHMTIPQMRNDPDLREIVVQSVGVTGYITLIDARNYIIVIHKYPERETNISSLKEYLPSFWSLLMSSAEDGEKLTSGYYDWEEVDGSIRKKYASIVPITYSGQVLTLWATTYIDEFSKPAEEAKKKINTAITDSSNYINNTVDRMQDTFIILYTVLVIVVIGLALLLSQFITRPVHALKRGAEAIGRGNLDYKLEIGSKDELGDLANAFNNMSQALKINMEVLRHTGEENINKEKQIQKNLHLYVQNVSQAQEAERKRVARELHDETAQALVAVLRHLDDLASGNSKSGVKDIREEVRKILEGVRHFSQELRPSVLDDLGLIPAVQWLASELTRDDGIIVETEIKGTQRQLQSETELMLFRITQEALTNIRKHSQATKVNIIIDFSNQGIKLTIKDNGKGFDLPMGVAALTKAGKLGMAGMEERAQLLGGDLLIESQVGKGTSIILKVPLSE